jgi:hypothetical protein
MPPTPEDAPLDEAEGHWIPSLAELYDRFAHSLDPFSEERDRAERGFKQQVSIWYDVLEAPKPTFHEFQKGVILRCKRHLAATNKTSAIKPEISNPSQDNDPQPDRSA